MSAGLVLRAAPDVFRVGFASLVAYRAEMVIWILTATMPLIMLALWNSVAMGQPIAGYDQDALARYFGANLVVRQLSSAWLVWILSYEIRFGALSTKLLKPVHPLLQHMLTMVSAIPFRVVVLAPMVAGLVLWRPELLYVPDPVILLQFGFAVMLAFGMNFAVQAAFGSLGFWIDKSDAVFGAWFSVWIVLSGYIAPLAVYPEWAQPILRYSPFRGMLGLPVELLAGELTRAEGFVECGVQLVWLGILVAIARGVWSAGLRRYGAFGA